MAKRRKSTIPIPAPEPEYHHLVSGISQLLDQARRAAARTVNGILTATYWEIGRRIIEFEQGGQARAAYGERLLQQLGQDLAARHGRGFSMQGLYKMRSFFLGWAIFPTASGRFRAQAIPPSLRGPAQPLPSTPALWAAATTEDRPQFALQDVFPLPWSHYVRLLAVQDPPARTFYKAQAIRGGWSVRQLDRQISTQFYERTSLSKNKQAMLERGQKPKGNGTKPAWQPEASARAGWKSCPR
jgi:hypothetical protein